MNDKHAENEMTDLYNIVVPYYACRVGWYHNLAHINNLLEEAASRSFDFTISKTMYEAILFHDIVYDIAVPGDDPIVSNEAASAMLYKTVAGQNFDQRVVDMIEATEHHFDGTTYTDHETNLLLDLDILGFSNRNTVEFLQIQQKIEQEYMDSGYDLIDVISGRIRFLTNIRDHKLLQYRVIDDARSRTLTAYENISTLIKMYEHRREHMLN